MNSPYLQNHTTATDQTGNPHIVTVDTRYVNMQSDRSKWLKCSLKNGGEVSLCEYTKVTMIGSNGGRTSFKIADNVGDNYGKIASLADENVRAHLLHTPPTVAETTLKVQYQGRSKEISKPRKNQLLDQQWGTLTLPSGITTKVTLNSVWDDPSCTTCFPIPVGRHCIMTPDNPHKAGMTDFYVKYAKDHDIGEIIADQVWFPIELENTTGNSTRYVHMGNLSEGCVTVYEIILWRYFYKFLISHRIPGTRGKYVASLEVTK